MQYEQYIKWEVWAICFVSLSLSAGILIVKREASSHYGVRTSASASCHSCCQPGISVLMGAKGGGGRVWKGVRSISLSEGEEASSLGVQILRC